MSKEIGPGFFYVKSCIIENYDKTKATDIYDLILSFSISEGINQVMVSASVTILDTTNLIDEFPIQGEETITFVIEDFYGVEKTYEFQVYNIGQVNQDYASKKLTYTLSLYSKDFIFTESREIRRSFTNNIDTSVYQVYLEYFTQTKNIDIEITDGIQTLVIPALTPYETMMFLARKAYTDRSPSSTFKFFETRDDFKFITYDELIARVDKNNFPEDLIFTYIDPKVGISTPKESMKNLIDYKVTKRFNLLSEMRRGGMINKTLVLDLSKKTIEENVYKHYEGRDEQESVDDTQRPLHTTNFTREFFGDDNVLQSFIVFNDTTKPESYYNEILPKRVSSNYYFDMINVYAQAYGSFKIRVGDMIKIDLPNPNVATGNVEEHETYSGFFIVESINHQYDRGGQWIMNMNLIKDSLKGAGS